MFLIKKRKSKKKIYLNIILILILSTTFFNFGVKDANAVIKILSNSRHAFSNITSTIDTLLGSGHIGVDIIVHSTNLTSGYTSCCSPVFNTSAIYYDEAGVGVASQAPYQIYTSSFDTGLGDTTTQYNQYDGIDFMHNLAFTTSPNTIPPVFITAPGGNGWASSPGVEWTLDGSEFSVGTTLSSLTAANAGMMTVIRHNNPTWNWFDVKAALRQTGTNWATGYNTTDYGFGVVSYASSTALTDNEILLQPPSVATSTSSLGQLQFIVYPFKQTRRVKEVLFQFSSTTPPTFQSNELTLAEIQTLGGTKVGEYTKTTATIANPVFSAVTDKYYVWLTADNSDDSLANFSRIETYGILGPLSQSEIDFSGSFDISTPNNHDISTSTTPSFTWEDADGNGGISKYQLFIDGNLNTDNISGTSTTLTSGLSEGTHTWYVKAINGIGNATTSVSTRTINILTGYTPTTTFYVDNVLGSDDNTGAQNSPWKTLTKATNTAQAGNTVIVIKNDDIPYRESLAPANSGDSTDGNIIFRGVDSSNKPEIWGSDNVSQGVVGGWTLYGGGNANTYQKSFTNTPKIFYAGSATSTLSSRTKGASAVSLNEGEWYFSSSTLYYRLNSGENINTLHIEAGQRRFVIQGAVRNTFKDIIIKYAKTYGIVITIGNIAEGVEVYDSSNGVSMGGTGVSVNSHGPILRHSVVAGSNIGINLNMPSYARVYNNTIYGNTTGLLVNVFANNSIVKNNIFSGNTTDISLNLFNSLVNFNASNNNWSGVVDSDWTNTYKGNSNQASTTPLLADAAGRNFRLQKLSPNIDTGTSISGITTDILGNPIYGTPDLGAYEYQPPYIIGTHQINTSGNTRLYSDGKYRYTNATSTNITADITIRPQGGWGGGDYSQYMDLTIDTWSTTGDQNKQWTATSSIATTTVTTIGDLLANTYYQFKIDGTASSTAVTGSTCNASGACQSDSSGNLTFNYIGGYSTHTFALERDTTSPASFNLSSPTNNANATNNQPTFSWNASSDASSGISKYQLYVDGSLDTDNISGTSATISNSLSCGEHSWYVVAVDNDGNTTNTDTRTLKQACGGGIFTGSVKDLPGYIKPRLQTIQPDGTIVYHDEIKLPSEQSSDISKITTEISTTTINKKQEALQPQQTFSAEDIVTITEITPTPFTSKISRGDFNDEVVKLQKVLRELGFFTYPENTGYFGLITEEAVKEFQKEHGIETVGTVGPKTRATLNSRTSAEVVTQLPTPKFSQYIVLGTFSEEVTRLQQVLRKLGFFVYPENTGYFGSITSEAVKDFQRNRGIDTVGVVGPQTRRILNALCSRM